MNVYRMAAGVTLMLAGCGEPEVVLGRADGGGTPAVDGGIDAVTREQCAQVVAQRLTQGRAASPMFARTVGDELVVLYHGAEDADALFRPMLARLSDAPASWREPSPLAPDRELGFQLHPAAELVLSRNGHGALIWRDDSLRAATFHGDLDAHRVHDLPPNPTGEGGRDTSRAAAYVGYDDTIAMAWLANDALTIEAARVDARGVIATETVAPFVIGPETPSGRHVPEVRVAARADGEMFAAWSEHLPEQRVQVFVSRRAPAGDWSPAALLSAKGETAISPFVATLPDGSALAVWLEWRAVGPEGNRVMAARYRDGAWSPERVEIEETTATRSDRRLILEPSGRGFFVFNGVGPAGSGVVLVPFDPETGFAPAEIRPDITRVHDIAVHDGFALALQHDGQTLGVSCRRRDGRWTRHRSLGVPGSYDELLEREMVTAVGVLPSQAGIVLIELDEELWAMGVR